MKIVQPIGAPGIALPQVGLAAIAVSWGADRSRCVQPAMRDCALVRVNVTSDSRVFDRPGSTVASVPLPRREWDP